MKLPHLVLAVVLQAMFSVFITLLLARYGYHQSNALGLLWLLSLPTLVLTVVVASPISRLLRMEPLMIFAGPCPRCRTRPGGWWGRAAGAGKWRLACGRCGQLVELWVRSPTQELPPSQIPRYALRWPQFLGIWRPLDRTGAPPAHYGGAAMGASRSAAGR